MSTLEALQGTNGWVSIAEREGFGAVDSWDEYLCARRGEWGYELDVLRHEWLGEVPEDWFDEDGELLMEHRDENGDLKLPATEMNIPVVAHAYGGFVGPLVSIMGTGVQISDGSSSMVEAALEAVLWRGTPASDVQEILRRLA